MKKQSLTLDFCGIQFPNPLILPSGIAQEIPDDHMRAIQGGAGGITTKSLTLEEREGNPMPRFLKMEHGYLNSIGLKGPGLEKGIPLIKSFIHDASVPVIVSIFAATLDDFRALAQGILETHPQCIEVNLSCPNVKDDMGESLGTGAKSAEQVVTLVKKIAGTIPIVAKLPPNIPNISEVAKACEAAGADAICAINTIPGMAINIVLKKPILGAKRGGISGYPIKPVAILAVYEIYEAVKIPIIGTGGIETTQDIIEMMMAGATLVGVGSVTYHKGMNVYAAFSNELEEYVEKEHLQSISEIIGAAHS